MASSHPDLGSPERRNLLLSATLACLYAVICYQAYVNTDVVWSERGPLHWMLGGQGRRSVDGQELLPAAWAALTAHSDGQQQWKSQASTLAYFAALLLAGAHVLASWPWAKAALRYPFALLSLPFSCVALLSTWRLILLFIVEHTKRYGGDLHAPNMFVEAYVDVSQDPRGWLWSAELLLWVTVACTYLYYQGPKAGLSTWLLLSYVCLGFFGAISLSFPLSFAHLLIGRWTGEPLRQARQLRSKSSPGTRAALSQADWSWAPLICAVVALASILVMPFTVDSQRSVYVVALAVVHVILAVPFFLRVIAGPRGPPSRADSAQADERSRSIYTGLAIASCALHWLFLGRAVMAVLADSKTAAPASLQDIVRQIVQGGFSNLCQSSITLDAIFSSVLCMAYMMSCDFARGVKLSAMAPIIGPAAAFSVFAAQEISGVS